MDRKTWLAVGLCIAGIFLWQWYYNVTYGPYLKQQEELHNKQAIAAAAAARSATPAPTATPVQAAQPKLSPPMMDAQAETLTAQGKKDRAEFQFNNDAGGIEAVHLLVHKNETNNYISLNGNRLMPIGALATTPGAALGGFTMRADRAAGVVTFSKTDPDGLSIEKKFTLPAKDSPEAPYVVNLEVTFTNSSAAALSRPAYYLSTGSAAPIHPRDSPIYTRFDWSTGNKMTGRDVNAFSASAVPLIGIQLHPAQDSFSEQVANVDWTAVASQYFCTIVSAADADAKGAAVWTSRFVATGAPDGPIIYGIQGALGLAPFTVDPGKSRTLNFQIYAGPKELARLDALGHNEEAVMNFGMFGFISKFLLWGMNTLHSLLFGSYAAAIVVLTLIIKSCLWPLQNKATNSMRKMSALSPKMTELREKYKDDPTKMNEELMKLYRDYGVNPFSGCLPMLIQIPIFFGFYGMLGSAIELRNSSFLWIHDLTQPDTIGHIMGFPINILPLVMAGTMLWQMAVSPKTGDAAQQRMMMFMPVVFIAFAYNYASALSLYWTTQNLFSIVQLYLTRNRPLPTLEKIKKRPGPGGSSNPRKKRPS